MLEDSAFLSDPPHLNNWFSSYEYQSPMSDEDDFKVCATQESEPDKDESVSQREMEGLSNCGRDGNKEGEGEKLFPNTYLLKDSVGEKTCCKIPECSELSAFSGPPDIGNWFSSYVYESPDMHENSELVIAETEFEEDTFANPIIKKDKEMEFQKLRQSISPEKEALHFPLPSNVDLKFEDDNLDNECEENEVLGKEKVYSQYILGVHCLNDACAKPDANLLKDMEISRLSDERPQLEQKQAKKFPGNPGFISSRTNDQHVQIAVASTRKATNKFNNKENGEKECSVNGFVSIKKKRIVESNDENSIGKHEFMLPCSKNKRSDLEGDEDKNGGIRRKVLSERSNFGETATAMEVTGKWKCPQKRKPTIGPPLKQLRLEQWVRRL